MVVSPLMSFFFLPGTLENSRFKESEHDAGNACLSETWLILQQEYDNDNDENNNNNNHYDINNK